jgi:hypothetical protein
MKSLLQVQKQVLIFQKQVLIWDPGGAKYGKMIKANKGAYVTAKCKMGRNKATKIT